MPTKLPPLRPKSSAQTSESHNALLLTLNDHVDNLTGTMREFIAGQTSENRRLHNRIDETVAMLNTSITQLKEAILTGKQIQWPIVFSFIGVIALAGSWIRSDTQGQLSHIKPVVEATSTRLALVEERLEARAEQLVQARNAIEGNEKVDTALHAIMVRRVDRIDDILWSRLGNTPKP